jgi:transposase
MTCTRHTFTDEQWERICPLLPPCKGRPGGAQRIFFDALLWMARTGAAWRDLPERLGKWNVVYQRYAYWSNKGHFERLFQGVQQPDMEEVMVDSTCCKAHQVLCPALKWSRRLTLLEGKKRVVSHRNSAKRDPCLTWDLVV